MPKSRVSIASLMASVLLVAVGLAALCNASRWWAVTVFLLTLGLLGTAILGAVAGRGRARMAWLGFLVFGWSYFPIGLHGMFHADITEYRFITTVLLDDLIPYLAPRYVNADNYVGPEDSSFDRPSNKRIWNLSPYHRIGHCLITLIFASTGALVGQIFAKPDERA